MAFATQCPSCTVSAAATSTLTYPSSIAHFVNVVATKHLNIVDGSTETSYASETLTTLADSTLGTGPVTTVTGNPTWEVSGTVLTYPTTYIQYENFQGAAATASDQCAQTLAATPLSLPDNVNQASLIYPYAGTALPGALLGYLDSLGLQSQLGGDSLSGCGANRQGPIQQGPIFGNMTTTSVTTSVSMTPTTTLATAPATAPPPPSSSASSSASSSSSLSASSTPSSASSSTPSTSSSSTPSGASSASATSSSGSSASSASILPVSSAPGESFTVTATSTSTGTTVFTSSVVNTHATTITTVSPPVTTTSPPFVPTTVSSTIVTAETATSVVVFGSVTGPTIITSNGSIMTQMPQSDMLPSSAATSFEGLASVLESILAHKPTVTSSGALPLISSVSLPGTPNILSAVTTFAGTPIYTNSNGSSYTLATVTGSGTINSTNATMTSASLVPYTGAATKDKSLQNVQWFGGLLGLFMPFLL